MKPPIVGDVAQIIGGYAEKVENRSLLLDKFVSHKGWPSTEDIRGKWDDASKWTLLRCTENGIGLLKKDQEKYQKDAKNKNGRIKQEKVEKAKELLWHLNGMMSCACRSLPQELEEMRTKRVKHLVDLFSKGGHDMKVVTGRLEARLAINLSDGMIQNGGICLDRIFGSPYIPGSAVKGVCRHLALQRLRQKQLTLEQFQQLFGTADSDFTKTGELSSWRECISPTQKNVRGSICFWAAQPLTTAHLEVDITNVHYPNYYQTGTVAELKKEQPRPNFFPVVRAGTEFAFFLSVNDQCKGAEDRQQLLDKAVKILQDAIALSGMGAKTGAGYGWFTDLTEQRESERQEAERKRQEAEEQKRREAEEREKAEQKENARRSSLTQEQRDQEDFDKEKKRLEELSDQQFSSEAKAIKDKSSLMAKAMAEVLRTSKKETWKRWKKKKPEVANGVCEALKAIGEELL